MSESPTNPYKAPECTGEPAGDPQSPSPTTVPPSIAYAAIGFMAGTALVVPLVLSIEPFEKLVGGVMYGGTTGAIIGYLLGLRKR